MVVLADATPPAVVFLPGRPSPPPAEEPLPGDQFPPKTKIILFGAFLQKITFTKKL
jgi:hypothetical protein